MQRYLRLFLTQHPNLLYLLALSWGISTAFTGTSWIWPAGFGILFWGLGLRKRLALATLIFLFSLFYVQATVQLPAPSKEEIEGVGIFKIHSVAKQKRYGKEFWTYQGTLQQFAKYRKIPCHITYSGQNRPRATHSYLVQGTLKGNRLIKIKGPWIPYKRAWSFAEMRYQLKDGLNRHIQKILPDPKVSAFFYGILTGEGHDPMTQLEFARFGLQHILVVSGFHFALVAAFVQVLLSLFCFQMNRKQKSGMLLGILSVYACFIGFTPSVMRAWFSLTLAIIGRSFFHTHPKPLNNLFAATFLILLMNPTFLLFKGFQLTVLITFSILFFYPIIAGWLQIIFPNRSQESLEHRTLQYFRSALALTGAVTLTALPLVLFHFQKFPLFSLLYNLFFPLLVATALILFLVYLLLSFIPGVVWLFGRGLSLYTKWILSLTQTFPLAWEKTLTIKTPSAPLLICYLTALFILGMGLYMREKERQSDFELSLNF